jgi:hypothetical protein
VKERRVVDYVNLYRAGMNRKHEEILTISGFEGVGSVRLDYDVKKTTLTRGSLRQRNKGGRARGCGSWAGARGCEGETGLGSGGPSQRGRSRPIGERTAFGPKGEEIEFSIFFSFSIIPNTISNEFLKSFFLL